MCTNYLRLLLTTITLSAWCTISEAQLTGSNLKFGNPTAEELKMTTYDADSSAAAVTLCSITDVSYSSSGGNMLICYDIKVRIKVLKSAGKSYANVTIPFMSNVASSSDHEDVKNLKATAFNLENGRVVKNNMEKSMEFTERVDKMNEVLKFTVPQVRVGTVFEYRYRLESPQFFTIDNWYAQNEIPTYYTEYHMVIPEYFKFNVEETGMEILQKTSRQTNIAILDGSSTLRCTGEERDFIGRNLPAVKDDDYVWHAEDYCSKVVTELSSIQIPGEMYKNFTSNWTDIDKLLLGDGDFGGRLHKNSQFKDKITAAGLDKITDVKQKIAGIYQLMKHNLRWNGKYSLWGSSVHDVLKAGTGDNADLNFILLNMLEDASIKAVPIVMRTRDAGRLPITHPTIKCLNTFVVGAYVNDSTLLYIDSSVDNGYLNVLPPKLLVDRARVIDKGNCFWVNIQEVAKAKTNMNINSKLDASGLLTGTITAFYTDNDAASFRSDFKEAKDSTTFVSQKAREYGIDIDKYQIEGLSAFSPVVKNTISFTKKCDCTVDHIYVNPLVILPIKTNPFTAVERKLPVEFTCPQMVNIAVSMDLPAGYAVESINKGMKLDTPENDISFKCLSSVDNNQLTLQFRFSVNRTLLGADKYPMIQSIFSKICEKCKDMVVLKKL
jgi:hypothetical protein